MQKQLLSGTTQTPLCVEFGSELQLPDTGPPLAQTSCRCVKKQHTNRHTVNSVRVFVWEGVYAVLFVCQPV